MMIVMPALPETQKRHNPLVVALVGRLELARAKDVADGIGAKGNMVHQENPDQAGPQETCPPPDHQGKHERQSHPEHVGAIDQHDDRVLQEMTAVDVGIRYTILEEPPHMRVKKAFHRAVGITLTV